jgi:hypothetical protein
MRTFGVVSLALGIVLLIFSSFPIILGDNVLQLALGLGCAGLLAIPMIVTGILLTRRAARHAGPDGEARTSEASLRWTEMIFVFLGGSPVGKTDPKGSPRERMKVFDINRVTLAGWSLLLATPVFLLGESVFCRLILSASGGNVGTLETRPTSLPDAPSNHPIDLGLVGVLLLFGSILFAVGFFLVGRLVLKALGIAMVDPVNSPPGPSNAGHIRSDT